MKKRMLGIILSVAMAAGMTAGCSTAKKAEPEPAKAQSQDTTAAAAPKEEGTDWPKSPVQIIVGANAGGGG